MYDILHFIFFLAEINNMATTTPTIQCFQGEPYQNADGVWLCPSTVDTTTTNTQGGSGGLLTNPTNTDPTKTTATVNIFSLQSIYDWITAHPYITLGGGALILYFLFFRK